MEVACVLIPDSALADPVEAGELTEGLSRRLERIGAAVESGDRGADRGCAHPLRRAEGDDLPAA
jgi:hypothetical protein